MRWRRWFVVLGVLLLLLLGIGLAVGAWLSVPGYRGPRSDHFDGRRFHNRVAYAMPSILSILYIKMEKVKYHSKVL